ncbi:hypothetical protein GV794_18075 [Nocardia cyriacigeorgica]|uniref:Uncharacterized protein n=1 Tax=Nocardia cyriacigeorgica TaxID=135487 RepID=A0A6P1DAT7_9NOCA|nr:hypothetical protein [Nocardia cyriacigeorgica]NEW38155.1 hypothetical protein [Nocardia cyriacigeorgica]NEW45813.1 hypothetical protein [Nocardia cyriacigeorgica]NEW48462.1 hypothetical protein [Nocardia cyriacigeorgica]NEW57550.1 hypothetical protein [Nocardia cyriacigeorgica]
MAEWFEITGLHADDQTELVDAGEATTGERRRPTSLNQLPHSGFGGMIGGIALLYSSFGNRTFR